MKSVTTNSFRVGDQLELEIEKLTFKGSGLGRTESKVIFVPYSAPLDQLLVEITEAKKNFYTAKIIKIIKPSPQRQDPPCELFYKCGGCNWQHLNYESQINAKELILDEILERQLKFDLKDLKNGILKPFLKNSKPFNYRNRIQVKSLKNHTGFFSKNTHEIIDMEKCLIAEESINLSYQKWKKLKKPDIELTKYQIKIVSNNDIENKLSLSKDNITIEKLNDIKSELIDSKSDQEAKSQSMLLGFSQVNNEQNKNLIDLVLTYYSKFNLPKVLDLYGGPANFSGPLALNYSNQLQAVCVELNFNSYSEGLKLKSEKKLTNLKMINADVESYLKRQLNLDQTFVILDPPREGLSSVTIHQLLNLKPTVIVYISCDPMTWARDVLKLKEHYQMDVVQGLDMFPQTDHFEIFSLWTKIDINLP